MKNFVWISLVALAAAGCASDDADRASGGATSSGAMTQGTTGSPPRTGDNAGADTRTGDTQARRDNRDSRPGSREAEERR
jgi:hypothetical protein